MKIIVAFCSPAGSTEKVAEVIRKRFIQRKVEVEMVNLAKTFDRSKLAESIKTAGKDACLFIGSPVYMDRATPPVLKLIEGLPVMGGPLAVPFVTWGGACSGLALWQLGGALIKKGFKIVSAAKVLAVHAELWLADDPLGKGHPDQSDYHQIEEMVDTLASRFDSDNIPEVSLGTLMYQPAELSETIKENLNAPSVATPKQVNEETCTQCGICQDECPAAAVVLNPFPEFGPSCFDCLNCIRLCPEDAITSAINLSEIEKKIRAKAQRISEQPPTQIFI